MSALETGGRRFDPGLRHTKDVIMVPVTLLDAQHYKASTSFSSPKPVVNMITSMIGIQRSVLLPQDAPITPGRPKIPNTTTTTTTTTTTMAFSSHCGELQGHHEV